jgi:hypothetical protein
VKETKTGASGRWVLADDLASSLFKIGTLRLYRQGIRPFETCEDLAQDCLERCLGKFESARGTDFRAYYFQALRNAAINHGARPGEQPYEGTDLIGGGDGTLLTRSVAVQKALMTFQGELDGEERSVFDAALRVLASLDTGLTNEGNPHGLGSKGARMTGISRDIFLRTWDRVRRRLRERLERELALGAEDWPDAW